MEFFGVDISGRADLVLQRLQIHILLADPLTHIMGHYPPALWLKGQNNNTEVGASATVHRFLETTKSGQNIYIIKRNTEENISRMRKIETLYPTVSPF